MLILVNKMYGVVGTLVGVDFCCPGNVWGRSLITEAEPAQRSRIVISNIIVEVGQRTCSMNGSRQVGQVLDLAMLPERLVLARAIVSIGQRVEGAFRNLRRRTSYKCQRASSSNFVGIWVIDVGALLGFWSQGIPAKYLSNSGKQPAPRIATAIAEQYGR